MSNCLNCGKPVEIVEGRRPRQYCDNKGKCKGEYRRKQGKKQAYVSIKSFKELQEKFEAAVAENEQLKSGFMGINTAIRAQGTEIKYDQTPIKVEELVKMATYDRTDTKVLNEANADLSEKLDSITAFEQAIDNTAHNNEIYKQIKTVEAEKIPKERDTPLGRKYWHIDQQNKIKELEKQLK